MSSTLKTLICLNTYFSVTGYLITMSSLFFTYSTLIIYCLLKFGSQIANFRCDLNHTDQRGLVLLLFCTFIINRKIFTFWVEPQQIFFLFENHIFLCVQIQIHKVYWNCLTPMSTPASTPTSSTLLPLGHLIVWLHFLLGHSCACFDFSSRLGRVLCLVTSVLILTNPPKFPSMAYGEIQVIWM